MHEPGPRPKVNYKKLYGAGDSPNTSKRDLRQSSRHISFQEQQLQKTLEEEERLRREQEKQSSEPAEPEPVEWEAYPEQQQMKPQQPERQSLVSRMTPPPPATRAKKEEAEVYAPSYGPPPQPLPRSAGSSSGSGNTQTVMEIAPNLFVPYKGSHETWEAVQRGEFTVTTCFACCLQLVVIDTAEFLVCPDCHTVSPLSYSGDGSHVERSGVGLGIKREWCDTEAALPNRQESTIPSSLQSYPTTSTTSSSSSYHQRHQEKQAKYERSPSPEQQWQHHQSNSRQQATYLF